MFNLKQFSLSVATIAATITLSAVCSTAAQAAIVGGRVSGIWQDDYDGAGGLSVGDTFTADYTYASDSVITTDFSSPGYYNALQRSASLLSLVFNSGSFSHTFNLSPSVGSGSIFWQSFQSTSADYGQSAEEIINISASDYLAPVSNYFQAHIRSGIDYNGNPFSGSFVQAESYDYSTGTNPTGAGTSSVNFGATPAPTAVPTPALLPGLIGLGLGVLRQRKAAAVSEE